MFQMNNAMIWITIEIMLEKVTLYTYNAKIYEWSLTMQ